MKRKRDRKIKAPRNVGFLANAICSQKTRKKMQGSEERNKNKDEEPIKRFFLYRTHELDNQTKSIREGKTQRREKKEKKERIKLNHTGS